MILSPMVCSFAATNNFMDRKESGDITIQYQSIAKVDYKLTFNGATANSRIDVVPKGGVVVDRIVADVKLMMIGNATPVKTWKEIVYTNAIGEFTWTGSHKVTSRGTYYFSTTIKSYRRSTLLETITGESGTAVY